MMIGSLFPLLSERGAPGRLGCGRCGLLFAYLAAPAHLLFILGLWPAVWSMGNLGRMGYGARWACPWRTRRRWPNRKLTAWRACGRTRTPPATLALSLTRLFLTVHQLRTWRVTIQKTAARCLIYPDSASLHAHVPDRTIQGQ